MLNSQIINGWGDKTKVRVLEDGSLLTRVADTLDPQGENRKIYNKFMNLDGTGSDSPFSLALNGATTPIEAFIAPQNEDFDLVISSVTFVIEDAGAVMNEFGNIGTLSNGLDFFYEDDLGEQIIRTELTSNFEIVRMCGFSPAYGSGSSVFRIQNARGGAEAYTAVYHFDQMNGFANGIRFRGGTNQRLVVRINDNISGVDNFDVYVSGNERRKLI